MHRRLPSTSGHISTVEIPTVERILFMGKESSRGCLGPETMSWVEGPVSTDRDRDRQPGSDSVNLMERVLRLYPLTVEIPLGPRRSRFKGPR